MKVETIVSSGDAPPPEVLEKAAGEFARRYGIPAHYAVTAVWVGAEEMIEVNGRFFGCREVTDVISVNIEEDFGPDRYLWGEIYTCGDAARTEASLRGVPWESEALFCFVHGLLHLAGRDDATMEERGEMWKEQRDILRACGLPPPYSFKDEEAWKLQES